MILILENYRDRGRLETDFLSLETDFFKVIDPVADFASPNLRNANFQLNHMERDYIENLSECALFFHNLMRKFTNKTRRAFYSIMKLTLSAENLEELYLEAQQQFSAVQHQSGNERIWQFSTPIISGKTHRIQVRDGLELILHHYNLAEGLIVSTQYALNQPRLSWDFWITGQERITTNQGRENFEYGAGQSRFAYISEFSGHQELLPGEVRYIEVNVTPEQLIELSGSIAELPKPIASLLEKSSPELYLSTRSLLPAIQMTIQQILNCPYHGVSRRLYLESRTIDLIAESLSQSIAPITQSLKSEEIDRIQTAQKILLDRLDNPPSLMELAQQVGLNDCTLKRGFRQVVGTTAFDYFYQQRMAQARLLLLSGECSISKVAEQVGYTSLSAFSTAFRRKFGYSPRDCQSRRFLRSSASR